jgi:hypothetical protein
VSNQPYYVENAAYQVLDKYKQKNEVIEPITLAIIGIILVAAFFAFSGCLMSTSARRRDVSKICKRPPLFVQWKLRGVINNNTPKWSYSDRRRLFNAVLKAGSEASHDEIMALHNQIVRESKRDKFLQECRKSL